MGYVLPGWMDEILDFIGINWPNVDEDDYREMAEALREFAGTFEGHGEGAHAAVSRILGSSEGWAVDALEEHWSKVKSSHLDEVPNIARLFADSCDVVADIIFGMKTKAEIELGVMAASIGISIGLAFVTGGLSALIGAAETAAMRELIRRIIREAADQIVDELLARVTEPITGKLEAMVEDKVLDLADDAFSMPKSHGSGGTGMRLNSAGGGSGGGGGGRVRIDHDEHESGAEMLSRHGQDMQTKSLGQIGRAKGAFGRTRGRDPFTQAFDAVLDGALNGTEKAMKKVGKHLADSVPGNIRTTSRNHRDNEQSVLDSLNRLRKDDSGGLGSPHHGPGMSLNSTGKPGGRPGRSDPSLSGPGKGGQSSGGNTGCQTAGDPVDVVSGQMITSAIDLHLPGLLPLVLRRAYASDYPGGRLHGPGWSSSLDQRLEVDATGIHYAGDDAQILHYPLPAQLGQPVYPLHGARWPLTWDRDSDTVRIEDPDRGWVRHFASSGAAAGLTHGIRPLTALADRNGHRITFVRDDAGTPTEVQHSCGYRIAVDKIHTAAGLRIEGLRLLEGSAVGQGTKIVEYDYYPDGRLAQIVNSSGLPYVYEYDDAGRITAWIDRNGQTYTYVYDETGRVTRGIGEDGHLSSAFHYDTARRITTVTDSLGHATEYHYDDQQRVFKTVAPLGHTTLTEYDAFGRLITRTDEIGRTTRFDLNEHGDPVRITEPGGGTVELEYTELRQLASARRGGTRIAAFTYDPSGNLLTTTDAAGAQAIRRYDAQGRLVSVTDALGHTRHLETNPAGLITAVTDSLGHTARVTYDAFGRVIAFTDPLGATTRLTRRTEGEITERIHPDGTRESWTYDPEGNVIAQTDQAGALTRFQIGPFGQLTTRILPDGEEQSFEYDTELRLLGVTTNGATWRYHYDAAGHLIGEADFNGRSLSYRLDGADQLLQTTDSAGRTTTFTYDTLGQLIERRNHDGTTTALTYDDRGCLIRIANHGSAVEYTHDALGRVLSETVDGRTTTYTYDLLGRRTSRTTPTGIVSNWTYDANNQPTGVHNTIGALGFAYDAGGRETTRNLGGGAALTQTWDVCNRLTGQSIWAYDGTPGADGTFTGVQARTYGYRPDGMPATITDRLRGQRAFDLTPSGRVTRVTAQSWSETYAYDPLGNITHAQNTRQPDSDTAGERTYTGSLLRTAGRTSYEHDDRGRLTRRLVRTLSGQRREWRYTWNAEDQLVRIDTPDRGTWAYDYDPVGRRTAKRQLAQRDGLDVTVEEVFFSWDGVHLVEQTSTVADGTRHTLAWDWQPGTWTPLSQTERAWQPGENHGQTAVDQRFFAIVTDLTDTPSELVTTDGRLVWSADTDVWGSRLSSRSGDAPACPLGRPGQYHDDETGLEYNYFRYYDPATGRYLSTDPLGLNAGPNPHAYVPNPLYWIDPLGLAKQPSGMGGWYNKLLPANWTDGSDNTRYEVNHVPAKATYLNLGLPTDLKESTGPSIRMEYDDHRDFISTGSGKASDLWRAKQRALILQGKFDEAMKMDIDEIRRKHGTKYDAAIKEMADSLPNNRKFQKYLADNGWKIRTCLLQ